MKRLFAKRKRLPEDQLAALRYLLQHGSIELMDRDLTAAERAYVSPRVAEIERIDHVLATTKTGGTWTNQLGRMRRDLKREIDVFFFERRLSRGTWLDEKARHREYPTARGNKAVREKR
jgi:hypothetical protein